MVMSAFLSPQGGLWRDSVREREREKYERVKERKTDGGDRKREGP